MHVSMWCLTLSANFASHITASWLLQMLVLLNCTPSDEMKQEGLAREVVNKIQKLRKKVNTIVVATQHTPLPHTGRVEG